MLVAPLYPLLNLFLSKYLTTTEEVGRAMIEIAARGSSQRLLENRDIRALATKPARSD